jgi:hypothetical protein
LRLHGLRVPRGRRRAHAPGARASGAPALPCPAPACLRARAPACPAGRSAPRFRAAACRCCSGGARRSSILDLWCRNCRCDAAFAPSENHHNSKIDGCSSVGWDLGSGGWDGDAVRPGRADEGVPRGVVRGGWTPCRGWRAVPGWAAAAPKSPSPAATAPRRGPQGLRGRAVCEGARGRGWAVRSGWTKGPPAGRVVAGRGAVGRGGASGGRARSRGPPREVTGREAEGEPFQTATREADTGRSQHPPHPQRSGAPPPPPLQ